MKKAKFGPPLDPFFPPKNLGRNASIPEDTF